MGAVGLASLLTSETDPAPVAAVRKRLATAGSLTRVTPGPRKARERRKRWWSIYVRLCGAADLA